LSNDRQLLDLGVATLHEAAGRRGLIEGVRLLVGNAFAGPAVTVALPAGDNLGIHLALEAADAGSVLCVGSAGRGVYGVVGELLLEAARARRLAGLVLDDGIRDSAKLEPPPSIAARRLAVQGTLKRRIRSPVGADVALGGYLVRPGDWVVCDRDGTLVVDAAEVASVADSARTRLEREREARESLRGGQPSRTVFGLPAAGHASAD
jgi:4-hydroxy-4-methyl-2-oxoglutarate aldolase